MGELDRDQTFGILNWVPCNQNYNTSLFHIKLYQQTENYTLIHFGCTTPNPPTPFKDGFQCF